MSGPGTTMQIAQNYQSGELVVAQVPMPGTAPGGVTVRTWYSLISTGTELMKVRESAMSLYAKARARPDQVRKVREVLEAQGPVAAYHKVRSRLDSLTPLGYSLAGVVETVGEGVEGLRAGQLVACAGSEFACHAERNWVPAMLCVPVPDGVEPCCAAFATVGAIALQSLRQGAVQLGETACVIGLGLVGQLLLRLLVASGVHVVGVDVDPARCRLGERAGAHFCGVPGEDGDALERAVAEVSGGVGADRLFLAAAGGSTAPVELATRLVRDRGVVVVTGKSRLDLPWNAWYEKELELRFSRSYGPGRYDHSYEVEGVDYPAGYVRWTERRNIASVLSLMASGRIDVRPLISGVFPLSEATEVYHRLAGGALPGIGYLFSYPGTAPAVAPGPPGTPAGGLLEPPRDVSATTIRRSARSPLRVGFVGAGNYASSMLLPHLVGRSDVVLARVVTATPLSAADARRRFGFERASVEASEVLDDDAIDAVFIVTPHDSHAALTADALARGKAVFVEKPLAITGEETDGVLQAVERSGNDRVMVGFNRRFSPILTELRARFGRPGGPVVARYLVNAGKVPSSSWYARSRRQGSRFVGEGGHFIDTLSWWVGAAPIEVRAVALGGPDDVEVGLSFPDGSTGSITYVTCGHAAFPKETLDVSGGGRSARLDNFIRATVWKGGRRRVRLRTGGPGKGQREELQAFLEAVRLGAPMPVPLASLVATTRATLAVASAIRSGAAVPLP